MSRAVRAGTALAPLIAGAAALALLCGWVMAGGAGRARPVRVADGVILIPTGGAGAETAVFFTVRNPGDVSDQLTGASWQFPGPVALRRHQHLGSAGRSLATAALPVPARGELAMAPMTGDLVVTVPSALRTGQRVRFALRFRYGPRVQVDAVAMPAGCWRGGGADPAGCR
ncbi:copper chaperone PCu(A)C [Streptantibioticus ferralitis]|uniref:Copper chaperone PCu(A)C n=1 Tax=Streptantibioticus ferralitis TaxID=236510 RepID=A0ABT5YVU3_9ACTN|nr:copper chaperone PCu(A)C [Streptantibioticus ferralitis]MDF2255727.1 copper chaperone PCu(A)C [Streptantibioticus ferralitis]